MDKVERAVIDLDGDPGKAGSHDGGVISVILMHKPGCYRWVSDAGAADHLSNKYTWVCTYPEFLETRKRLENKPTEWPEGRNYLVHQPNGGWGFSTNPPSPGKDGWRVADTWVRTVCHGHVFGDWRNTLERRPEKKAKQEAEPEGVEWDGEGFPPVGVECEFFFGDTKGWLPVLIVGHDKWEGWPGAVYRWTVPCAPCYDSSPQPEKFRPIQSHRDKVVEAAYAAAGYMTDDGAMAPDAVEKAVQAIADADLLKLPEEQE